MPTLREVFFLPELDDVLIVFQSLDVYSIKMNVIMCRNRALVKHVDMQNPDLCC